MTSIAQTESISKKSNLIPLSVLVFKVASSLAKVAKSFKFILAAGSFASYSFLFTWKFAILVMFGVGIHEMGHVYAMRRKGMKTKGFYFIPLFGGAAVSEDEFKSGKDEIYIALMGPVFGILTIGAPLFLFLFTKMPIFAAAASWLAMINLFNLFPVNPLDGGRVVKSLAFSLNSTLGYLVLMLGFLVSIFIALKFNLGLLAVIAVIGMMEIPSIGLWIVIFPFHLIIGIFKKLFVKNNKPILKSWFKYYNRTVQLYYKNQNPEKRELTNTDKLKYTSWYFGMAILFVIIIFIFGNIPGADIAKQFLES